MSALFLAPELHAGPSMKKVAVFGNTGGGKSTLARRLAGVTGLPLYPLDLIQYRAGGGEVPPDEFLRAHADLLEQDAWIIERYGSLASTGAVRAVPGGPGSTRSERS